MKYPIIKPVELQDVDLIPTLNIPVFENSSRKLVGKGDVLTQPNSMELDAILFRDDLPPEFFNCGISGVAFFENGKIIEFQIKSCTLTQK